MIRPSRPEDLNAVFELEKQFGAEAFSKKSLRRFHKKGNLLVFLDNFSNVIGSALLIMRNNSRKVRLYSFIVDEKFRGKGVGQAYLSALESHLSEASGITLEVSEANLPAIRLYTKAGYQPTQKLPDYYHDGSAAIKMFKNLKN